MIVTMLWGGKSVSRGEWGESNHRSTVDPSCQPCAACLLWQVSYTQAGKTASQLRGYELSSGDVILKVSCMSHPRVMLHPITPTLDSEIIPTTFMTSEIPGHQVPCSNSAIVNS